MSRMTDLSHTLWRQRRLLEHLLYRVEVQHLMLAANRTRWIATATARCRARHGAAPRRGAHPGRAGRRGLRRARPGRRAQPGPADRLGPLSLGRDPPRAPRRLPGHDLRAGGADRATTASCSPAATTPPGSCWRPSPTGPCRPAATPRRGPRPRSGRRPRRSTGWSERVRLRRAEHRAVGPPRPPAGIRGHRAEPRQRQHRGLQPPAGGPHRGCGRRGPGHLVAHRQARRRRRRERPVPHPRRVPGATGPHRAGDQRVPAPPGRDHRAPRVGLPRAVRHRPGLAARRATGPRATTS